ncbi:MAG: SDR family oxidoreductase [Pyrinomonadaceae bacterium]|nr:SDR family oxidoreductase [Phycisphaerales bacterium]
MTENLGPERSHPVAIVTGAGSGIGRAIAVRVAARGFRLVLAGRHEKSLRETGAMISAPWIAREADMADYGSIERLIDETTTWGGRLDVLVNCAGSAPLAQIDKTTPEMLDETYRVNATGPAYAIARAWPIMVSQQNGCIVNISSMATTDPYPGFFMYAGAKAACNLMVKSCASEGKRLGIRAFSVAPGAVETPMLRRNFTEKLIPAIRCLSPDYVAVVVAACIAGERDNENGQTIYLKSP